MKKLVLIFALLIGVTSFYNKAEAQNINISINIGRQPAWGPVGYDYVGYYYFPEINCYYDVNVGMFYYPNNGYWVSARYLPYSYRHYDLYGLYKVVLNVRNPWCHNHVHYRDYARYRGNHHYRQVVIRDSRDHRYRDSRNNNVRWYSSDRKHNNHNNYNYRSDNNRSNNYRSDKNRPNNSYNNYNHNNKHNNQAATRPNNNSRPNNDYNKNKNNGKEARPNTNNSGRDSNRQNMNNRDNNNSRQNNSSRNSQRSGRENMNNKDNNKRSNNSAGYRLASNDNGGRGR